MLSTRGQRTAWDFVIAPHLPDRSDLWNTESLWDTLYTAFGEMRRRYSATVIDHNRVYVTGNSRGGRGALELACRGFPRPGDEGTGPPQAEAVPFSAADVERYVAMRRTGHGWPDGRETKPRRTRTIQGEIKQLRQMIYWAMNERLPDGSWLLESNPLRGVKVPKEEDPRRPVATYDRFLSLRTAAQEMAATAPQKRGRERWKRWEMALVLAEATGARIGAISGLRWSDISNDPPEIKFRAAFDKRGRDRVVPIPEALAEELRGFKVKFAAVGDGWLFPCADKDDHWPREIFGELDDRVERHAELPHLKGGRFHPFRRKWATERKNMSLVDVMAAGGWRDAQTLHSCYQLATTDGMLEVMSTPVKLRDRKVSERL